LGVAWRGVPHHAALGGAGGGREEHRAGRAEGRRVLFRRNRGRKHGCQPRVVLAGYPGVPMLGGSLRRQGRMPWRKGAVRLFAAHRLTVSWLPLDAVLGALLRAWIPPRRGQEGHGGSAWRAAGVDGSGSLSKRPNGTRERPQKGSCPRVVA